MQMWVGEVSVDSFFIIVLVHFANRILFVGKKLFIRIYGLLGPSGFCRNYRLRTCV